MLFPQQFVKNGKCAAHGTCKSWFIELLISVLIIGAVFVPEVETKKTVQRTNSVISNFFIMIKFKCLKNKASDFKVKYYQNVLLIIDATSSLTINPNTISIL